MGERRPSQEGGRSHLGQSSQVSPESRVSQIQSWSLAGRPLLTPCGKTSDSGGVPSLPLPSNSASPEDLRVPSPSMLSPQLLFLLDPLPCFFGCSWLLFVYSVKSRQKWSD